MCGVGKCISADELQIGVIHFPVFESIGNPRADSGFILCERTVLCGAGNIYAENIRAVRVSKSVNMRFFKCGVHASIGAYFGKV